MAASVVLGLLTGVGDEQASTGFGWRVAGCVGDAARLG
jgi:hypothetical protein